MMDRLSKGDGMGSLRPIRHASCIFKKLEQKAREHALELGVSKMG